LLAIALALFYLAQLDHKWFGEDTHSILMGAARYAINGCIVLGALYLYLPHKVDAETMRKAWNKGLAGAATEILDRAETAREALATLYKVGNDSPSQLPIACSLEFSQVAAFCAGWRVRRRRRFWERGLSNLFTKANQDIFDFVLTLEISGSPSPDLDSKRDAAVASIDKVILNLRRTLQMPDTST
jgi:hypothetical protein